MKVASDPTQYRAMLKTLESIARYKETRAPSKSDALYYRLVHDYYERVLRAREEGKFIAAYTVQIPTELFYALDIVPMFLEGSSMTLTISLKNYEQVYSAAKGYGLTPEVCSAHRCLAAGFILGWVPRPDVIIWSNQVCDNTAKSGDLLLDLYDVPGYFMDSPFRYSDKEMDYFAQEIEELARFLERLSGKELNPQRLEEVLLLSREAVELHREIYELRRASPYPLPNRRGAQMAAIIRLYMGSPEAVEYLRAVRDEARERVERGEGYMEERYRLIALFTPPNYNWKLLDWMEREHGACIVAEPYNSHWGDFEYDLSRPWLTLARRAYRHPTCRQMHGPVEEGVVEDAVNDALSHGAEAAIYWAHIGCRQTCATIRTVKDALAERVGIPTLVLDMDTGDPSFVSDEELKDKLESFFEMLSERK